MTPTTPEHSPASTIQYGLLEYTETNFLKLTLLLAKDPIYGRMPLSQLLSLQAALANKQVNAAVQDGQLIGACAWACVEPAAALAGIATRTFPNAIRPTGDPYAALITLIASHQAVAMKHLLRKTVASHKGRIVIFERHVRRNEQISNFGWVDRSGVKYGPDLG